MTADDVRQLMRTIHAVWPDRVKAWNDDPRNAVKAWHLGLGDLPFPITEQALTALIQTSDHPPTIAMLRRAVLDLVLVVPIFGAALAMAKDYVKNGEVGGAPKYILAILDLMGTPRAVRGLSDFAFERAFKEAWDRIVEDMRAHAASNIVALIEARENGRVELANTPPALSLAIGESQRRKNVDSDL